MRERFSADATNASSPSYYDGQTVIGERLWIGTGGTGTSQSRGVLASEPDGAGGIVSRYVAVDSTLHDLPVLGVAPDPAVFIFGHEGTMVGAPHYLDGDGIVVWGPYDGNTGPQGYFRYVQPPSGAGYMERYTKDGATYSNGAKNQTLDATEGGLVVVHDHGTGSYPQVSFDTGDGDFEVPTVSDGASGASAIIFKLGHVGEDVWYASTVNPALSKIARTGPDAAAITRVVSNVTTLWGDQYDYGGGFGPVIHYVGPAGDQPGLLMQTSLGLNYHDGLTNSEAVNVEGPPSTTVVAYQNVLGETWRILSDLRIQRLLAVDPVAGSTTWANEADLDYPTGWTFSDLRHAEITESGSVWLIASLPATFPGGATANDIAVAYYRSGAP